MSVPRLVLAVGCLLLACCGAAARAAPAGPYAVVVSRETHADKAWRRVVDALRAGPGLTMPVHWRQENMLLQRIKFLT